MLKYIDLKRTATCSGLEAAHLQRVGSDRVRPGTVRGDGAGQTAKGTFPEPRAAGAVAVSADSAAPNFAAPLDPAHVKPNAAHAAPRDANGHEKNTSQGTTSSSIHSNADSVYSASNRTHGGVNQVHEAVVDATSARNLATAENAEGEGAERLVTKTIQNTETTRNSVGNEDAGVGQSHAL